MANPSTYSFVAGHYTATWGTSTIGTTRDGFKIMDTAHVEQINIDEYGDAPVDGIQRGIETRVELDYAEYPLIKAALYAQSNASGGGNTSQGSTNGGVGILLSTQALPLVLTPAGGTGTGTLPWTFSKAIIVGDIPILMATKLRQGPVQFHAYPVPATGNAYTPGS